MCIVQGKLGSSLMESSYFLFVEIEVTEKNIDFPFPVRSEKEFMERNGLKFYF